jgi:hypothetical protein
MSYDLTYWKPPPFESPDPQATYERLNRNDPPDELHPLPLPQVIERLKQAFPDFDPTEEFPGVKLQDGSMKISYTEKSFRFDFRPPTASGKAKVWEIMSGFGCVCYDPQTGKLHTAADPPEYAERPPDVDWLRDADSMTRAMRLIHRQFFRAAFPLLPKLLIFLLLVSTVLAAIVTGFVYLIRWVLSLFATAV